MKLFLAAALVTLTSLAVAPPAGAADFPPATEHDFLVRDFKFGSGETLPSMNLHYRRSAPPSAMPPASCGTR